jgi:hypothetical protein
MGKLYWLGGLAMLIAQPDIPITQIRKGIKNIRNIENSFSTQKHNPLKTQLA